MIARTERPNYPWTCWFVVVLAYLIQYGLLVFPASITSQIQSSLNISSGQLGIFSSAFLYSFVLFQIPAGLMLDHFGSRTILFCATVVMALGCVLLGLSSSYFWGVVARLLMGLGGSFTFVGAIYVGRTWFPVMMFPIIVGLTESISGLGEVALPALFTVSSNYWNWRVIILVVGIVTLAIAFLIYVHVRDKKRLSVKHHVDILRDLTHTLKNKNLWLIAFFTGFAYAHFMVMADMWGIMFLKHRYNITDLGALFENSLVILGFTIGCVVIGYVARSFSTRRIMLVCIIGEMVCHVILTFYLVDIYVESVLLFVVGLLTSVIVLSFDLAEKMVPSTSYGMAAGFINMFANGIGMLIVPFVGYLANYLQLQIYLASAPVVFCGAIGIIIAIRINLSEDFAFCDRKGV